MKANESIRGEGIKFLTQEQVSALFKAASGRSVRDRLLLVYAYRFGMRTQELCDLPAKAVDIERGEITITGLKGGLTRTYSLPRDVRPLVKAWEKERDKNMRTYFHGRQGPLHRIRLYLIFKECAREAGLPDDIGLHSLRHSAAVHALDAGLATEDVRDLLRHRRIATTDVYATLSTRRRGDYLKRLEESAAVVKLK